MRAEQIASQKHIRRRADGTVVEWQQEDESAVTTKAEAIAIVQRTIDFWLPKLIDDLCTERGIPLWRAKAQGLQTFQKGLATMLDEPFPRRWGLKVTDFALDVTE